MEPTLAKSLLLGYKACLEAQDSPIQLREMSREEFDSILLKAFREEAGSFHRDDPGRFIEDGLEKAGHTWNSRIHAYTIDGTQGLVTTRNKDGSSYIYLVYVPEEQRGQGIGSALVSRAVQDSPQGISLHTAKENTGAYNLYRRLGFREYPSVDPDERFMATKPNIGGNEWWTDEEKDL